MAKNFIQNGDEINVKATTALKGGELLQLGELFGVVIADIAQGEVGAVSVIGVWELPAKSDDNITQGSKVYWDSGAKQVTTTKGSNKTLGIAWTDSPNLNAVVAVKLNA